MKNLFTLNLENGGVDEVLGIEPDTTQELNEVEQEFAYAEQDEADEVQNQELAAASERANEEIQNNVGALVTLESIADHLRNNLNTGAAGLTYANLALEAFSTRYKVPLDKFHTLNLESCEKDPVKEAELVLEGIGDTLSVVGQRLAKSLSNSITNVTAMLGSIKAQNSKLGEQIIDLERLLEAKKKENINGPKSLLLQPKRWFANLCFHASAPSRGLTEIHPLVQYALSGTLDITKSQTAKYVQWINRNKNNVSDPSVFASLNYKTQDFVLKDSTKFNGRLNDIKPDDGEAIYRSKELPGGQAVYAHVSDKDLSGVAVNEALWNTWWRIEDFDAVQYQNYKTKLFLFAMLLPNTWGILVENYLQTGNILTTRTEKRTEDGQLAQQPKVKITRDFAFETLSIPEIERVIREAKEGQKSIDRWLVETNQIVRGLYIPELTPAANDIEKQKKKSGTQRALLDLMHSVSGLHENVTRCVPAYAIRTYTSMLRYATRSLAQY